MVMLSLVAGACGGSTNSGSSSTSNPSTSSTPTTAGSTSTTASSPSTTATSSSSDTEVATTTGTSGAGGSSGSGGSSKPTITSVIFTGTTMTPTVTVNGSDLGSLPPPNPTYTPEGHPPLCPLTPSGNQGYDYGTSFYLADTGRNWAGGRYRPSLNELDCIGLVESKFTQTQVVFQFGSAYAQYQQQYNYLLAEGDPYQLQVNSATFSGTVHYT